MTNFSSEEQKRVGIYLETKSYSVAPGGSVSIPIILLNTGGEEDYFEVALKGIPEEWVSIPMHLINIFPGEKKEFAIKIQAPPPPQGKIGRYPFTLQATSQMAPQQLAEISGILTVAAYEVKGRIGVLIETTQFSAVPGNALTVKLFLANQGVVEDHLGISVEGIPASWISTSSPVTHLQPGEQKDIALTILPPRSPQSRAGRNRFKIRINSRSSPDQFVDVDCTLTVAAFSHFTAELNPQKVVAGQTTTLILKNLGNTQQNYSLTFQSQTYAMNFNPPKPEPLRIRPGETGSVQFEVTPRQRPVLGGEMNYPYSVKVQALDRTTQVLSGEVATSGLIPVWAIPVGVIMCLCLVLVVSIIYLIKPISGVLSATERTQTAVAYQIDQIVQATQTVAYLQTQTTLNNQQDPDRDYLNNQEEAQWGTDPNKSDTDGDGLLDGDEVKVTKTDPRKPDTDGDGLTDGNEVLNLHTNPTSFDTDGDGIVDKADLDPLDSKNPSMTSTAVALLPTQTKQSPTNTASPNTATFTPPSAPTVTPTLTQIPPLNLGSIAFETNRTGNPEIFILNTSNNSVFQATINSGVDTQPAWSPDGRRIAFVSNRDGDNEIYAMNPDGTALVQLTNNDKDDRYPTWSPDGTSIAYTTNQDGDDEIYIMLADGSQPFNLTNSHGSKDTQPNWFMDKAGVSGEVSRIAFTTNRDGNQEIYSIRPDGTELTNLTRHSGNDFLPAGSPDGNKIAFTSDRDGNNEIYIMNTNGSAQLRMTNNSAEDTAPAWSPDSRWVAFVTNRDGNFEIYAMRDNGTSPMNLTKDQSTDQFPDWD